MYKTYIDGRLMYNPQLESDGYEIFNPKMVLEVNKASAFTFKIYPQNPEYANITKLKSIITVFDDDVLKFRGRVLNDVKNWNNDKDVTCEGELAFFNDSIIRPYDYTTGGISVSDYVNFLVSQHNQQVDTDKQFTVRNITVTDPNDLIVRGNGNYPNTLDEINEKLIKLLGGYIFLERIGDITYLDYLSDSPYTTTQKIELSKNLLDIQHTVKGEAIATAIIPLGAQLKDSNGQDLGTRLTLNNDDGTDYIADSAAVAQYGLIFKSVTYNDVTTQDVLLSNAQKDLSAAIDPTSTLTLTAIDLNMVDKTIDKLNIFEYVESDSKAHGLNGKYLITKLEIDMVQPSNNKVTIGAEYAILTDPNRGMNAVKNYVASTQADQTKYVNDRMLSLASSLQVMADQILSQVSENYVYSDDFTQYQSDVATQLQQTNDSFNFTFQNVTQSITNLDGDTQARFEDMSSWIRFVNGEIQLGKTDSPLSLSIVNNSISFKSNGQEIAYFKDNKLFVTDVEATNSLQLGKFKFLPRANGNLSFLKTED